MKDIIPEKTVTYHFQTMQLVETLLRADKDFFEVHFSNIIQRFSGSSGSNSPLAIFTGFVERRPDLSQSRSEKIAEFKKALAKQESEGKKQENQRGRIKRSTGRSSQEKCVIS
eukprot:TRINITY_DN14110_c0_g2_i1.p1 TRINITY_DN14110_c0_g2~~TRINITY_DN14110_c0_g2_i1.p1  ORF type:complete len:113 (-),score=15.50 TRINITY_DN14110_c0_g2_i1:160-498(-)